ncbi:MAG TPA: winged-helix domain-containing protein [Bacteroidales bacterium]|nr:winged-helix domain-containing protein [Bacteroidales bacterium]
MKSDNKSHREIPASTYERIADYLPVLKKLCLQSRDFISLQRISTIVGLPVSTVKADLEELGIRHESNGICEVKSLISRMEENLEVKNAAKTYVFMAGNTPRTTELLRDEYLHHPTVNVVAIFEKNPADNDSSVLGVPVLDCSKLVSLARRMHVTEGILTSLPEEADYYISKMAEAGINLIRNHTGSRIEPAEGYEIINI